MAVPDRNENEPRNPRSRRSSLESSKKIEIAATSGVNNRKPFSSTKQNLNYNNNNNNKIVIPSTISKKQKSTIVTISPTKEEDENQLPFDNDSEVLSKSTSETEINFKSTTSSEKRGCRKYAGILFCLLASFTMSLSALIVKLLHEYHPFTLTIWRYVGNIVPSIPLLIYYIYWKEENIFSPIWPVIGENNKQERNNLIGLLARGIFGGAVTILRFCALTYLSLADVSVITRTPALVIVLAYFCLGEKCNPVSIISAVLSIAGVFILSRPPILTGADDFDTDTLLGLAFSTGALVCSSVAMIITRKLRKVNFALLIFAFGIVGILEGGILSWSTGTFRLPHSMRDILLTVVFTILTFIGQVFAVLAVKCEGAGPISVVRTSYVLFTFAWQIIFLHIYPDIISIIGASIVFAGIVLVAARKSMHKVKKHDDMEKALIESEAENNLKTVVDD